MTIQDDEKRKGPKDPAQKDEDEGGGGHTYGNEPPVKEPPAKEPPKKYEV